jgi:hypothetical protein
MRRSAALAVGAGLLVIVVAAIAWWRPFLTNARDYPASIPQTVQLYTTPLVTLPAGSRVCFEPAVLDRRSAQARFRVTTFGGPGVALELSITGAGYRYATRVPGTYADNALLQAPVRLPAHDLATRICLGNAGARRVALYGVDDVTRAPLTVTRDGRRINPSVQFAFFEGRPVSLGRRMPTVLARMSRFRPGFMGPWLFWPLALLVVVGLPAGALWSLRCGVVNDRRP